MDEQNKGERKSRLEILRGSKQKKQQKLNDAFQRHFDDVAAANGQPLNDKRNGATTLRRWEREEQTIRTALSEVEKTERAIEREELKVARVADANDHLPAFILDAVTRGEIVQWRRHPTTFFVPGVDKGRIVFDLNTGALGTRYLSEVTKDQYPQFRDTVNRLLAAQRAQKAGS